MAGMRHNIELRWRSVWEEWREVAMLVSLLLVSLSFPPSALAQKAIINIDGAWSPWSTIATPCNVSCGGGFMIKVRSCTNPKPQGLSPQLCEGDSQMVFPCNTDPCDMQWSPWGACSAKCGRGMRMRYTQCARVAKGPMYDCVGNNYFTHTQNCNTWNKATCPSPCEGYTCMTNAACVDVSTDTDPATKCVCQLGKIFAADGVTCIDPPPTTPTPRPIPTMQPATKSITTGVSRTASSLLVMFVGLTLFLFAALRIYDPARIIQMNMEIALISAHLILIYPKDPNQVFLCRLFSIFLHLLFTTCFVFMFLEALHTYSLVAYVVKRNGLLTRTQNVLTGWGFGIGLTLVMVALQYENYGGVYHCWLQLDSALMLGEYVPITVLVVLTLTLIEAAGAAEYRKLPGIDQKQQFSAKIMQRSNLIIMPMVFVSFIMGTLAEYEQNVGLYGSFTIMNGVLGFCIFFFHCTGNERVRAKLMAVYNKVMKKN